MNVVELLKNNDVVRNGKVIGRVECDGAFFGLNFIRGKKSHGFMTLEEVLQWFNQN